MTAINMHDIARADQLTGPKSKFQKVIGRKGLFWWKN